MSGAAVHGQPAFATSNSLEPFCGVKATQILIESNTVTLYHLPLRYAFIRVNQTSTGALNNGIELPIPQAANDSQSQVAFVWWDIDASFDGQAAVLTWLYPRAPASPAYPYAATPINGSLADYSFTRAASDTRRNIFFVIVGTPSQGYYIRSVKDADVLTSITSANAKLTVTQVGQAFTLTDNVSVVAGSGTSVSGTSTFTVNAFAGVPVQLPNVTLASSPAFYGANGVGNGTEANVNAIMFSQPGTISNLYVTLSAGATATSHTFTVRKGSSYGTLADSVITCVILLGASSGSDLTHSIAVAAGDIITIKDVQAGTPEALRAAISLCFKPSAV